MTGQGQRRRGQRARDGGGDLGQRGNKWWTLLAVCLGMFMLLLDITIVNVALPDIQKALRSSFSDLQWIVDAYALTLAAFLLTAGSLADGDRPGGGHRPAARRRTDLRPVLAVDLLCQRADRDRGRRDLGDEGGGVAGAVR